MAAPSIDDKRPDFAQEIHLLDYLDVVLRRRWLVALCLLAVVTTVMAKSLATQPLYTASTTIQIEPDAPRVLDFESLLQVDATSDAFYQTQYRLVESRSLARRVIDKQGLLENRSEEGSERSTSSIWAWVSSMPTRGASWIRDALGTAPPTQTTDEPLPIEIEDARYRRAIDAFLGQLTVEPIRNTRLATISWTTTSPVAAATIANAIAKEYMEMSLEARFETTAQASEFLAREIERVGSEIAEAEAELQQYGSERDILSGDDRQDTVTRQLTDLSGEFTQAQTDRVLRQSYYEQLQQSAPSSVPEIYTNDLVERLNSDNATLQQRYADLSRQFTDDWPEVQSVLAQIRDIESRIAAEEQRLFDILVASAGNALQAALDREQQIEGLLDAQKNEAMVLNRNLVAFESLRVQIDNNRELMDSLLARQSETGVSARLQGMGTSNIRIVDPAAIPLRPTTPNVRLNLILALATGLVLGLGSAFAMEYMDTSLRSMEDVESRVGAASLGIVPSLDSVANSGGSYGYGYFPYTEEGYTEALDPTASPELVSWEHPRSSVAEAYRTLRTSVLLSHAGQPPRTILVTSSIPGEGKTTTAVNLAISLAQTKKKVLIVDADLRRPRLHRVLNLDPNRGLAYFLTGASPLKSTVEQTDVENLWAVACGPRPPNPSELLTSDQTELLLERASAAFDVVILDSPPVMAVVDGLIVAPMVDGVVLVAHGGRTPANLVAKSRRRIEEANGKLLGVVLNNLSVEAQVYNRYYRTRPDQGASDDGRDQGTSMTERGYGSRDRARSAAR